MGETMVLVNDGDNLGSINHRCAPRSRTIDQPIVPECPPNGEGGNIIPQSIREHEIVNPVGQSYTALFSDAPTQVDFPIQAGEIQLALYIY